MGKMVVLCPGQGAQFVGMGKAWREASALAAGVFDAADRIVGSRLPGKLSELCASGPETTLNRTDVAQPAIFVASVACFRARFGEVSFDHFCAFAGLSLGEYSALHLGGAMDFESALELVLLRGRAMQDAAEASKGSMVALIGADEAQADAVCAAAAQGEVLVPANYNAPGQIVLSGHATACDRAVVEGDKLGLKATKLQVAGSFHSPLMAPAAERLGKALATTAIKAPRTTVMSNVTAQPHAADPSSGKGIEDSIRARLVEQLTQPVRWSQGCSWLVSAYPSATTEYHELAPNKVLSGLMRRIDRGTKVVNHDAPAAPVATGA